MYEATWESVRAHEVPTWFHDAKLGIFLHWGLYSVPGWAPQVADIQSLMRDEGPAHMLANNPYAEWYLNSMQIPHSPTQQHHSATYGDSHPYSAFAEEFNQRSEGADLGALAALCNRAGARYVVVTTKHHDGFCLWPSAQLHPKMGAYHTSRDLVGDLTQAVVAHGMRMGLYYSGGYDWPYNDAVLSRASDAVLAVPTGEGYRSYAEAHVRELIDRYRPSVLWNDIGWPAGGNLAALFAHCYNTVEECAINDRWLESNLPRNAVTDLVVRGAGELAERMWRFIPQHRKELTFPAANHYDFTTPEYKQFDRISERKWEATRGVGHSFGANRHERPEDIVTATELVRSFVDIVAKNGNLLIGIGPEPDGTIPEVQRAPLEGLGAWLSVNGEAIYGTRPWTTAEGVTTEGTPLRFTQREDLVYAILTEAPGERRFSLRDIDASDVTDIRLVGVEDGLEWSTVDGRLHITLPERLPVSPAHTLRIEPSSGIRKLT